MKKRNPFFCSFPGRTPAAQRCVDLVPEVTVHEDGSGSMRFARVLRKSSYEYAQELIPEGYE